MQLVTGKLVTLFFIEEKMTELYYHPLVDPVEKILT